jgi:hypothetical protein
MSYDGYPPPQSRKPNSKRWLWMALVAGLFIILCVLGSCTYLAGKAIETTPSPAPSEPWVNDGGEPPPSASAPQKPEPAKARAPQKFGDGTRVAGEEMEAGTYRSSGAEERGDFSYCIWTVWEDEDQKEIQRVGSSSKTDDPQRVTLKNGELFKTAGCGDWEKK